MSFKINVNAQDLLEDLDRLTDDMRGKIRDAVNETIRDGYNLASQYADAALYNSEGYKEAMHAQDAHDEGGDIVGRLINDHQWAMAIEEGTPPHEAGPDGFRVGPHRPPYPWHIPADRRGWRTFFYHKGARAFGIFGYVAEELAQRFHERMVRAVSSP
uniref:Tail protein n=1 Tax=viral metagenome TaxID=1070528 RepID=A0A6M3J9K5_9ZZZZ